MPIFKADVVRHFLHLEATRKKFSERSDEILSWCKLSDDQLLNQTRIFADSRDDTNPALAYTVGTTKADYSSRIVRWERRRINCSEIYTCGISFAMQKDIEAVAGNMREFALRFASNYPEFQDAPQLPKGDAAVIIVIAQKKQEKKGIYEVVDGVHRLVALCRDGLETVESYIGS